MLLQNARRLRKSQTDAERYLWYQLRDRRFVHFKFRRQHQIGFYIVDFICLHRRIIIELDGGQHTEQKKYDDERTAFLISQKFKVLRFWNHEVFLNTEAVLTKIYEALTDNPHPVPLPL